MEVNIPVRLGLRLTKPIGIVASGAMWSFSGGMEVREGHDGRGIEREKRKSTYQFDWRRNWPNNRNRGRQEPRGRFLANRERGRVVNGEEDRAREEWK